MQSAALVSRCSGNGRSLAVYVWLFVAAMLRQFTLKHLTTLLFLWQTQTGAGFAIAAALIGAIAVLRQTAATEQRAEDRRERRTSAMRAVLPLMLAELSGCAAHYAEIFGKVLQSAERRHDPNITGLDWPEDQHIPPLPSGLTEQLRPLIALQCRSATLQ